jgi:hypothetical protein
MPFVFDLMGKAACIICSLTAVVTEVRASKAFDDSEDDPVAYGFNCAQ